MRILGLDPGPTETGWAIIERASTERWAVLGSGHTDNDTLIARLPQLIEGCDAVAIEWIERVRPVCGGKDTGRTIGQMRDAGATCSVQGRIRGHLEARGVMVALLTAAKARKRVVGTETPGDRAIKNALGVLCVKAPPNGHGRDAAVVAIAAAGDGRQMTIGRVA